MSDTPTTADGADAAPATPEAKAADERLARRVEALLARPDATGDGRVRLADGRTLAYRVHAGFVPVRAHGLDARAGEPQAAVFTTAYTVDAGAAAADGPAPAPAQRPVCFVFNGGPGSSSMWLHLGAVGPRRVPVPDDGGMPATPYTLVDNPHTWLAHFDLVFIDPPHTGWSISASAAARKRQLSVDGDVEALAEVVRAWLSRHRRFGAPLYLCGESYGTTRAAALTLQLLEQGLGPEGVVLVSCAMDLQSLVFSPRNDLPHALFLPGFTHVAHHHGCLKGPLAADAAAARAEAEAFAQGEYLSALHAGSRLQGRERQRIERRLAELTGLPLAVVQQHNLRIRDTDFFFELLRGRGQQVGRLDARCTAPLGARRGREFQFDPGIDAVSLPYTAAVLGYYRGLGLDLADRFECMSMAVNEAWRWARGLPGGQAASGDDSMGFCSTGDDLAQALRRHPLLKVLVASGHADLGTPYAASDWSLAQLDAPPEVLARITHHHYDGGHMMYTRSADLAQLQRDLAAWLAAPPAGAGPADGPAAGAAPKA